MQDNSPSSIAGSLADEVFLMALASEMLVQGQGDRVYLLEQFEKSTERSNALIRQVKDCLMFRPPSPRQN